MKKRDEILDPGSCWNKAGEEEMIFVLRAKDPAAPDTIRAWCLERARRGRNNPSDPKISSALGIADAMEEERGDFTDLPALGVPVFVWLDDAWMPAMLGKGMKGKLEWDLLSGTVRTMQQGDIWEGMYPPGKPRMGPTFKPDERDGTEAKN